MITSPGKFEGEPDYVPELWDMTLDGFTDWEFYNGETLCSVLAVDTDLVRRIPALSDLLGKRLVLFEDELGFVYCVTYDADSLEALIAECDAAQEESE
jgi:hypothetical protein